MNQQIGKKDLAVDEDGGDDDDDSGDNGDDDFGDDDDDSWQMMTISMKMRPSAKSTYAASEIYEHPDWKQLFQSITSAFASIAKNIQANVLKMTQMGDNQSLRPRKLLLSTKFF